MSNRFAIVIEGIDDPSLVTEIEQTIRNSFEETALPGSWRVTVRPSIVSGRWDFSVHGLDAAHPLNRAPERASDMIPRRLEESLNACGLARAQHCGNAHHACGLRLSRVHCIHTRW